MVPDVGTTHGGVKRHIWTGSQCIVLAEFDTNIGVEGLKDAFRRVGESDSLVPIQIFKPSVIMSEMDRNRVVGFI